MARSIPDGFHSLTPVLNLVGVPEAIDFYQRALGAEVEQKFERPDGAVGMAMLRVGDSRVMLEEAVRDPATQSGILLYVDDADASWQRAVDAGAQAVSPVADKFWGDRWGMVADRWGNRWAIASRRENVSDAELRRRVAEHARGG